MEGWWGVYVSLTKSDDPSFGNCKSDINHAHQLRTFAIFFMEIQPLLLSNTCPRPYFKQRQKPPVLQRQLPGVSRSPESHKLTPIPWVYGWLSVKFGNLPQTMNPNLQRVPKICPCFFSKDAARLNHLCQYIMWCACVVEDSLQSTNGWGPLLCWVTGGIRRAFEYSKSWGSGSLEPVRKIRFIW